MLVWRICRDRHLSTAFSGEGAWLLGGRWNSEGTRVAYASDSLALAALEMFVHVGPLDDEPSDLFAVQAEVPVDPKVNLASINKLPADWRYHLELSQRAGDAWAETKQSFAMLVPSVVVDVEWNVLINPDHADAPRLKVVQRRPFRFDERMFKGKDEERRT